MTEEEIKKGVKLVCDTSTEIAALYNDNSALVSKLNSVPQSELNQAADWYSSRSGVIIDLRKDVLDFLKNGSNLDVATLDKFVLKHKTGKENQFRSYKNYYSIFFPIITFYGHNSIREFIDKFIAEIIERLSLKEKVNQIYFDFQGPRQQGSERLWLAIYNKNQKTQSTGLQIFADFHSGKIKYGVYRHSDKSYLKGPVELAPDSFDFNNMIKLFEENKNLIIDDIPEQEQILKISLNNKKLYKISHGSFKSKSNENVRDIFKDNQWIVMHENTGKGQAELFQNDLREGDFVYITIGANELFAIAKIKVGSWDYVSEDITEATGWMFREVEYIKSAVIADPSEIKNRREFIYPSGNSTLTEITADKISEANEVLFKPYFNAEFTQDESNDSSTKNKYMEGTTPLNKILFGPPGTGKTFNTVSKAISIANPEFKLDQDREIVKAEFDRLMQDGQIVFTTFHQSMSYEDFIEGIKPIEPKVGDTYLKFEIQNGILKDICERIKNFEKLTGSNLPVGNTITNFDQLYSAFIEKLKKIIEELDENEIHFFESRRSKVKLVKIEDNSILTNGETANSTETVMKDKLERIYNRFKSPDEITNIVKQLREVGTDIGWTTNYFAVFKALKEFEASIKTNISKDVPVVKKQNYVLIIDEINRGNISQIFGELITLIEEDKRLGKEESLEVTLPYSKKKFGLPSNLYLIGTMNTADRSVEALDAALRRRFSFEETPPVPQLITDKGKLKESQGKVEGIDLAELLTTINKRIEKLLDKDHLIGHSYFMSVTSLKNLQNVFQNKINPLLQEYFFGDFGKIGLVLGGGFFENKGTQASENLFADFDEYESSDLAERPVYKLLNVSEFKPHEFIQALNQLMKK